MIRDRGKLKYWKKTPIQVPLCHKYHVSWPGIEAMPKRRKAAANRLNHGTACSQFCGMVLYPIHRVSSVSQSVTADRDGAKYGKRLKRTIHT